MCGRFTQFSSLEALQARFGFSAAGLALRPRYNLAPGQDALVVRVRPGGGEREGVMLRWGLVPAWAKDLSTGYRMINARAETAPDKPAFRSAFRRRRCLVASDGFYEWEKGKSKPKGGGKQPWLFTLAGGGPLAMAGLWERWEGDGESGPLESFTILTTAANELVARLHDRMPVILDPAGEDPWLAEGPLDQGILEQLLKGMPAGAMAARRVSPLVNSPAHEGPELLSEHTETEEFRAPGLFPPQAD